MSMDKMKIHAGLVGLSALLTLANVASAQEKPASRAPADDIAVESIIVGDTVCADISRKQTTFCIVIQEDGQTKWCR